MAGNGTLYPTYLYDKHDVDCLQDMKIQTTFYLNLIP